MGYIWWVLCINYTTRFPEYMNISSQTHATIDDCVWVVLPDLHAAWTELFNKSLQWHARAILRLTGLPIPVWSHMVEVWYWNTSHHHVDIFYGAHLEQIWKCCHFKSTLAFISNETAPLPSICHNKNSYEIDHKKLSNVVKYKIIKPPDWRYQSHSNIFFSSSCWLL